MGQNGALPDLQSKDVVAATQKKPRLLLADDHPEVLVEIGRRLMLEFDVLCSVQDGLALVKAASELKPDVVISDMNMPRLNGIEACRQILQSGFSKSAILLTVYDDAELRQERTKSWHPRLCSQGRCG